MALYKKSVRFNIPLHTDSCLFDLSDVEEAIKAVDSCDIYSPKFLGALRIIRDCSRPSAFNRDRATRLKVAELVASGSLHTVLASAIGFWICNELKEDIHKDHYEVFKQLNSVLWNNTDLSLNLCKVVSVYHILKVFVQFLKHSVTSNEDKVKLESPYLVKGILAILHNCLQKLDIGEELRSLEILPVLYEIQRCLYINIKCSAELVLSYLLTEEETAQKETSEKVIKHMTKILKSAVDGDGHYSKSYGMRATEVMQSLNRLASSDANKQTIGKLGVLALYVELLNPNTSNALELHLAAKGIWTFSFKLKDQIVQEPHALERLKLLLQHDDEAVRRAAEGALWILEDQAENDITQDTGKECM